MKRALYFSLKDYQEYLVEQLIDELKKILEEENTDYFDEIYLQSILFKEEISQELLEFKEKVEKNGVKIDLFISNSLNNNFKKCPYCEQIWLIDSKCSEIICGRTLTPKELEENNNRIKQNKPFIRPIGCGKNLNLSECEDANGEIKKFLK